MTTVADPMPRPLLALALVREAPKSKTIISFTALLGSQKKNRVESTKKKGFDQG
jgi:hypothetical protein